MCLSRSQRHMNFNSQPHREADNGLYCNWSAAVHFNSQPHREADYFYMAEVHAYLNFNSQPHREADVKMSDLYDSVYISTHSLTGRLT